MVTVECVIFYLYPATCKPKADGCSSTAADTVAVGFTICSVPYANNPVREHACPVRENRFQFANGIELTSSNLRTNMK